MWSKISRKSLFLDVRVLRAIAIHTTSIWVRLNSTSLSLVALEKSIEPARGSASAGVNVNRLLVARETEWVEPTKVLALNFDALKSIRKLFHHSHGAQEVFREAQRAIELPKTSTVWQFQKSVCDGFDPSIQIKDKGPGQRWRG